MVSWSLLELRSQSWLTLSSNSPNSAGGKFCMKEADGLIIKGFVSPDGPAGGLGVLRASASFEVVSCGLGETCSFWTPDSVKRQNER